MGKRLLRLTPLSVLLSALLIWAVTPARAADVEERIKALEEELAQLKSEQMELKQQATAAEAALPTFSYRAGRGILVEAADKAWSIRTHFRYHNHLLFRDGRVSENLDGQNAREGQGEVFARRIRPTYYLCLNNCFYEIEFAMDFDGFGTGAGHNNRRHGSAQDETNGSILQRAVAYIHFENINPWLPTLVFGSDGPADWSTYRQGSSNTSFQLDYDMLTRNLINTGSWGNGFGLSWSDLPMGPGRVNLTWVMANVGEGGDGGSSITNKKDHVGYLRYEPFARIKNKWIQNLGFEGAIYYCVIDADAFENGCDEVRIREVEGSSRETMFRANADVPGGNIEWNTGMGWRVGPYFLRAIYGRFDARRGVSTMARNWMAAHELMLWSPKGPLTGSYSTSHTVYAGWLFERVDAECNPPFCNNSGQFNRNRMLLRQLGVFYVVQAGMNFGVTWHWYDASNIVAATQPRLGIRNPGVAGRGGDWHNITVAFRWQF